MTLRKFIKFIHETANTEKEQRHMVKGKALHNQNHGCACTNSPSNKETNLFTYLPTAKTLPKVNNNANLIGLVNTIIDCK